MEDDSVPPIRRTPITVKDFRKDNEDGQVVVKRIPRKSEVQSQVDQMNVLGRILSQPVTLAVGEVFGISKELTHHLQDVLKPKSQAPAQIIPPKPLTTSNAKVNSIADDQFVATMFVSKSRGTLIKLRMECDGAPVQAIIDTGSQLNIAHKRIWKSVLGRPIDMHKVVSMSDANGGEGMLKGLVANVPLSCGGVMTHANVYVGDQVPFDLLLGRPWQRGNFVSIDERSDGTYLLFKDKNLEVRHEVLVTPDNTLTSVDNETAEFIDRTHRIHPQVNHIQTGSREAPIDLTGNNEDTGSESEKTEQDPTAEEGIAPEDTEPICLRTRSRLKRSLAVADLQREVVENVSRELQARAREGRRLNI